MSDTTTDDITAVTTVVDTYLATWNEADPDKRAEMVAQAWTPEGRYVDPLQEAKGHTALTAMAPNVHQLYPGARFRRQSGVDAHHGFIRFAWDLANEDGSVVVVGIDVGSLADDGRLAGIAGFFGDLPPE